MSTRFGVTTTKWAVCLNQQSISCRVWKCSISSFRSQTSITIPPDSGTWMGIRNTSNEGNIFSSVVNRNLILFHTPTGPKIMYDITANCQFLLINKDLGQYTFYMTSHLVVMHSPHPRLRKGYNIYPHQPPKSDSPYFVYGFEFIWPPDLSHISDGHNHLLFLTGSHIKFPKNIEYDPRRITHGPFW